MSNKRRCFRFITASLITASLITFSANATEAPATRAQEPVATEQVGGTILTVQPFQPFEQASLRVSGPENYALRQSFADEATITVNLVDDAEVAHMGQQEEAPLRSLERLADGIYRYEVVLYGSDGERRAHSGRFFVEGGSAVSRGAKRQELAELREDLLGESQGEGPGGEPSQIITDADYIYLDDLAGDGVTSVALDSDGAGVPAGFYWGMANDNDSLELGRTTARASITDPHITVNTTGNVGIGTTTPTNPIHVRGPGRMFRMSAESFFGDYDTSFGVGGTGMWIYDSSEQPIAKFNHSAAENTLTLDADGVGIGTSNPTRKLHVVGSDGATQLLVQEESGAEAARVLADLQNNGVTYFRMNDTSPDGSIWTFQTAGPSFRFNKAGTGAAEVVLRGRNDQGGQPTLTVDGSIAANNIAFRSTRASKTAFSPIDSQVVLEKVASLDISEWEFKDETNDRRHIGPIAEDFAETFELGGSDATVSMIDASGVAFAAIQGLYEASQEKDNTIADLQQENSELAERLEALEAALGVTWE